LILKGKWFFDKSFSFFQKGKNAKMTVIFSQNEIK